MSSHNIFSDTDLGGKLRFLQLPADSTGPYRILGIASGTAPSETVGFTTATMRTLLGISGTLDEFAFFTDTGNTLGSTPKLKFNPSRNAILFDADLNLLTNRQLIVNTLAAPTGAPTGFKVAVFDGANALKIATTPAVIDTGKTYYFTVATGGFGFTESTPGGGPTTGVTGSGSVGRAAKWDATTNITTSSLEFTSTGAIQHGNFEIKPSGESAFAINYTPSPVAREWFLNRLYMPDLTAAMDVNSRVMVNAGDYVRGADAAKLLVWLNVYTKGEVDTELAKYLLLTGGTLSGNLFMDKPSPAIILRSGSGNVVGSANFEGIWTVFQSDRSWNYLRNGLEYYSTNGTFKANQLDTLPGSPTYNTWVNRTVATFPIATGAWIADSSGWKQLMAISPIVIGETSPYSIAFDDEGFAKIFQGTATRVAYWKDSANLGSMPMEYIVAGNVIGVTGTTAFAVTADNFAVGGRKLPMPSSTPALYGFKVSGSAPSPWGTWQSIQEWITKLAEPTTAPGVPKSYVLKWSGSAWSFSEDTGGTSMPEPDADGKPYVRVRLVGQTVGEWRELVGANSILIT